MNRLKVEIVEPGLYIQIEDRASICMFSEPGGKVVTVSGSAEELRVLAECILDEVNKANTKGVRVA